MRGQNEIADVIKNADDLIQQVGGPAGELLGLLKNNELVLSRFLEKALGVVSAPDADENLLPLVVEIVSGLSLKQADVQSLEFFRHGSLTSILCSVGAPKEAISFAAKVEVEGSTIEDLFLKTDQFVECEIAGHDYACNSLRPIDYLALSGNLEALEWLVQEIGDEQLAQAYFSKSTQIGQNLSAMQSISKSEVALGKSFEHALKMLCDSPVLGSRFSALNYMNISKAALLSGDMNVVKFVHEKIDPWFEGVLDSHPLVYLRLGGIKADDFSAYLKESAALEYEREINEYDPGYLYSAHGHKIGLVGSQRYFGRQQGLNEDEAKLFFQLIDEESSRGPGYKQGTELLLKNLMQAGEPICDDPEGESREAMAGKRRERLLDVFSKILVIDKRLLIDHLKSKENFGELALENITGFHDDVENYLLTQLFQHPYFKDSPRLRAAASQDIRSVAHLEMTKSSLAFTYERRDGSVLQKMPTELILLADLGQKNDYLDQVLLAAATLKDVDLMKAERECLLQITAYAQMMGNKATRQKFWFEISSIIDRLLKTSDLDSELHQFLFCTMFSGNDPFALNISQKGKLLHQFFQGLLSGGLGMNVLFEVKKAVGADDYSVFTKRLCERFYPKMVSEDQMYRMSEYMIWAKLMDEFKLPFLDGDKVYFNPGFPSADHEPVEILHLMSKGIEVVDESEKTALIERAFAIARRQEKMTVSDFYNEYITPFVLPMMLREIEFDQTTFVSDVMFSSGELADFEGVSFKDKRLEGVEMDDERKAVIHQVSSGHIQPQLENLMIPLEEFQEKLVGKTKREKDQFINRLLIEPLKSTRKGAVICKTVRDTEWEDYDAWQRFCRHEVFDSKIVELLEAGLSGEEEMTQHLLQGQFFQNRKTLQELSFDLKCTDGLGRIPKDSAVKLFSLIRSQGLAGLKELDEKITSGFNLAGKSVCQGALKFISHEALVDSAFDLLKWCEHNQERFKALSRPEKARILKVFADWQYYQGNEIVSAMLDELINDGWDALNDVQLLQSLGYKHPFTSQIMGKGFKFVEAVDQIEDTEAKRRFALQVLQCNHLITSGPDVASLNRLVDVGDFLLSPEFRVQHLTYGNWLEDLCAADPTNSQDQEKFWRHYAFKPMSQDSFVGLLDYVTIKYQANRTELEIKLRATLSLLAGKLPDFSLTSKFGDYQSILHYFATNNATHGLLHAKLKDADVVKKLRDHEFADALFEAYIDSKPSIAQQSQILLFLVREGIDSPIALQKLKVCKSDARMIMNEALDRNNFKLFNALWDRGGLFQEFSRANLLAALRRVLNGQSVGDFGQVCRRVIDTYKRKAFGKKYLLWSGLMSAAGLVTSYFAGTLMPFLTFTFFTQSMFFYIIHRDDVVCDLRGMQGKQNCESASSITKNITDGTIHAQHSAQLGISEQLSDEPEQRVSPE